MSQSHGRHMQFLTDCQYDKQSYFVCKSTLKWSCRLHWMQSRPESSTTCHIKLTEFGAWDLLTHLQYSKIADLWCQERITRRGPGKCFASGRMMPVKNGNRLARTTQMELPNGTTAAFAAFKRLLILLFLPLTALSCRISGYASWPWQGTDLYD